MLVDHSDTFANRITRSGEVNGLSIDENFSSVGTVETEEDIHQRGFSSTVLSEKTMNFTGLND